jgi:hypothetical protein
VCVENIYDVLWNCTRIAELSTTEEKKKDDKWKRERME